MKKNRILKSITLLAIAFIAILGSCVDNDYDNPAAKEIPIGNVITIAQLKSYFNDSAAFINDAVGIAYLFKKDITVYATVTMDDKSGNLYEMAYIQDPTGAIALKFDVAGGIQVGDTIRLNLNGLVINQYARAYQINAVHGDGFKKQNYITTIDVSKPRTPEIATIDQITGNKPYYQGRLVQLENVQFVAGDTVQYYADYANFISRNLNIEDAAKKTLIVRTSGFAGFADEKSPKGSGSIIGVLGQYNNDMQLQIRNTSEVVMTGDRLAGGGGSVSGTGTFADPYNVASGIANQGQTEKWVQGYLVGVYETNVNPWAASFTAPFILNSNVIIAPTAEETNIANCLVIQLLSGEIRTAVNLADKPANKGKIIKFKGNLESYFSGPGLKTVNGYWMDGTGINPETPVSAVVLGTSTVVASLNEVFTTASVDVNYTTAGWLNANKQGERYWQGKDYLSNKYVQATAFGSTSAIMESWLVSPGVTLTTPKKLNFDTKAGYYLHAGLTVWVSTNFDGNKANLFTATWTQISPVIATSPSNAYGEWVNSGDVNLSSYSGTIYVLFKYTGNNTNQTTTFQLDNVKIIDL